MSSPSWDQLFPAATVYNNKPVKKATPLEKCRIIFLLMQYLNISFFKILTYMFTSNEEDVRHRATMFTAYRPRANYGPEEIYNHWHNNFPACRDHLHRRVAIPCAHEVVLQESDSFIQDPQYKVSLKDCTVDHIMETLDPGALVGRYKKSVPVTWALLETFTTSPNRHRRRKERQAAEAHESLLHEMAAESDSYDEDSDTGENLGEQHGSEWFKKGFRRNPTFALVFVISLMGFVRNTATNLFALIMGLFFEIGGTSSRVMTTLSNAGVCVSITTIERLKAILSRDAKSKAVDLMRGSIPFFSIFDNVNIYLRKFQQRLFNSNSMIHATNAAVIAFDDVDKSAFDLQSKLGNRGKRKKATGADIIPNEQDDEKIIGSSIGLVMHMLMQYSPGCKNWENRREMATMADDMMASDRPLPVVKTDARPLGIFDINEGSKQGIIKMVAALQATSTLGKEEWSSETRIIGGDWLTSANFRRARRERTNDINTFERMEYVEEISQLFHFALNASHMLMRLHFGNAILDPGSLAKHKGLLNRTWDAEKPNYSDAKALIRHSLVARILYSLMLHRNSNAYSDLYKWKPTPSELKEFATHFVNTYTNTSHADEAKKVNDDYLAHSIYFIRDALLFCEFEHAVSHADAGRVLRVMKYWSLSFRAAGLHNYGRECLEILLRFCHETTPALQRAIEKTWFVNRFGQPGRWIAADLYVEQLNFWVKRVFIAKGSGVTVEYIINKGSACVEVFRAISHKVSRAFGHADRSRRHKEVKVDGDIRLLCEDMYAAQLHIKTSNRAILGLPKLNKKGETVKEAESLITDSLYVGMVVLNEKFKDFLHSTSWDAGLYSWREEEQNTVDISSENPFQSVDQNPFTTDQLADIDDGDDIQYYPGQGSLGGGIDM